MKRFKQKLMGLSFAAMTIFSLIVVAKAAYYESAKKAIQVYGCQYNIISTISNNEFGCIQVGTRVEAESPSVPIGYIGVQARIYNSSQVMLTSGPWQYNTYATATFGYAKSFPVQSNLYYYSEGAVDLWNGNGYTRDTCARTPNYMPKSASKNDNIVLYDEDGEMSDSRPILENINSTSDLILAMGTNGKIGYVRADDLNADDVSTPEQAVAYMERLKSKMEIAKLAHQQYLDIIPLYDSDGVTVIGEYAISFPEELSN